MAPKPSRFRIREEALPSSAADTRVEAKEAEQQRRFEAGEEHLDLDSWGEWLRLQLPDKVHGYADGPLPLLPTAATPGSSEKLKVMRARARRGEALHHPEDCRELVLGDGRDREESDHA